MYACRWINIDIDTFECLLLLWCLCVWGWFVIHRHKRVSKWKHRTFISIGKIHNIIWLQMKPRIKSWLFQGICISVHSTEYYNGFIMLAIRIHAQRVLTASNVFQIDGHPFDIFGDFWYFIWLRKFPLISADISMRHTARIYIMIQVDLIRSALFSFFFFFLTQWASTRENNFHWNAKIQVI